MQTSRNTSVTRLLEFDTHLANNANKYSAITISFQNIQKFLSHE